ncbi:MAG: hypothetical protein ACLSFT_07475 [Ruminococcus callidus]
MRKLERASICFGRGDCARTVAFTVGTESFHHLLFLGRATLQTVRQLSGEKGHSVLLPAGLGHTVRESVQYVVTRVDEKLRTIPHDGFA